MYCGHRLLERALNEICPEKVDTFADSIMGMSSMSSRIVKQDEARLPPSILLCSNHSVFLQHLKFDHDISWFCCRSEFHGLRQLSFGAS